jgi:hypothetical protein
MKWIVLLSILSGAVTAAVAQDVRESPVGDAKPVTISASVGLGDLNRVNLPFSVPAGWAVAQTTGFRPLSFKIEKAVSTDGAVALRFFYDQFNNSLRQSFPGVDNYRFSQNRVTIFGGGVSYVYRPHFNMVGGRLQPFLEGGVTLCNVRQTGVPMGDSSVYQTQHDGYLLLKAGARYQIVPNGGASIYVDAGYDRAAIVGLGISCLLHRKMAS